MADSKIAKISEGKKIVNQNDPNAIFSPEGLNQILIVCEHFLKSGSLPSSYKNASQVLMAIQAGRELGMKPVESLNGMMIINGQIKLWGTALTGRITSLGYKIKWGACTDREALVSIIDPDGEATSLETYTIEEAKTAGLLGKQNWRGHAKTMLRWRALSNAVKFNFPHLLQGHSLVEDDDNLDRLQGEGVVIQEDNASKLLKSHNEIKEETKQEGNSAEIFISRERAESLIKSIEEVGSKLEDVQEHYGKIIYNFNNEDALDLSKKLKIKKDQLEEQEKKLKKNKDNKNIETTTEKEENPRTKAMREGMEKVKGKKQNQVSLPEDVCQYINSIDGVDDKDLPSDIVMLKIDANKGEFKGYKAYPNLAMKLAAMIVNKNTEKKEPKKEEKFEEIGPEILEVSNELASHDPEELTDIQKNFIIDVNCNRFKGKKAYPGVNF